MTQNAVILNKLISTVISIHQTDPPSILAGTGVIGGTGMLMSGMLAFNLGFASAQELPRPCLGTEMANAW